METSSSRNGGGAEENVLAILDAADTKHTHDANAHRPYWIAFLQAVRADYLVPDTATPPPPREIREAVFGILRAGMTLELMAQSFRLLIDLDAHFPRAQSLFVKKGKSDSCGLKADQEVWCPFIFTLDIASDGREATRISSSRPLHSSDFQLLIQDLAKVVNVANLEALETKSLGGMLLFQYLVCVLEADFLPRNRAFDETMNWMIVRDSLLSMLLSSRRVNYKSLIKDCLSIFCGLCPVSGQICDGHNLSNNATAKPAQNENSSVTIASLEVGSRTCTAMQNLLIMIMELDISRKKADMQGCTTRADGVRTPSVEIILDEMAYDTDMLSPFFEMLNHPKWKLEIILLYFSKYTAKPSVRTRKSNGSSEDKSLGKVLRSFSNITSTRNMVKKIRGDVVQLLLAHAFQAHLSLSSSHQCSGRVCSSKDDMRVGPLVGICKDLISAFISLRKADEKILPFAKEAVFAAVMILSTES